MFIVLLSAIMMLAIVEAVVPVKQAKAVEQESKLKWDTRFWKRCRVNKGGPAYSNTDVKRTIVCAVDHWPVPGGVRMAFAIASRESGFQEGVTSWTGCCHGVYQQHERYWGGRVAFYRQKTPSWLDVSGNIFDARSNVLVSIHMVSKLGWCPHWCGG